jgi:hypothetical protein
MSNLRYQGPAKPVPTHVEPFSDAWLLTSFAVLFTAFVFIVFVMGW